MVVHPIGSPRRPPQRAVVPESQAAANGTDAADLSFATMSMLPPLDVANAPDPGSALEGSSGHRRSTAPRSPRADDSSGPLRALIIRAAGTNCDGELAHAFRLAGAKPDFMHLRTLMDDPARFDEYHLIGVPGGFSYGDDIAAGRVFATYLRERLYEAFRRAVVERRAPVMAPCNGFQVLVKAGLLPGFDPAADGSVGGDGSGPAADTGSLRGAWPAGLAPRQSCTLASNIGGAFIDRWLRVEIDERSPCVWTRDLGPEPAGVPAVLPIAHGEGRFVAEPAVLDDLERRHLFPLRYAAADNANGSDRAIAGICDPTGLVFGLMPHPERYTAWLHHPQRTRLSRAALAGHEPLGLRMFRAAVAYALEHTDVTRGRAMVGAKA